MKDALDITHEYSTCRDDIFRKLKEDMASPGIRILCPTRWTVKAKYYW